MSPSRDNANASETFKRGSLPMRLRQLEAEAIYIMREAVAEFANPVMLYSIGKDSSVMLHWRRRRSFPASRHFRCCISIRRGNFARCSHFATRPRRGWAWT